MVHSSKYKCSSPHSLDLSCASLSLLLVPSPHLYIIIHYSYSLCKSLTFHSKPSLSFYLQPLPTLNSNSTLCKLFFLHLLLNVQISCSFSFFFFLVCVGSLLLCARAFFSCGERGLLFVAVCRLFIAVASLVVEHGL